MEESTRSGEPPGKERMLALFSHVLMLADEYKMDIVLRFQREPEPSARRLLIYVADTAFAVSEPSDC